MNTKQLTAFAEGMMRETSTQAGEWVTVSRIALDEMAREALQAIKALQAAERERDEYAEAERSTAVKNVTLQDEIYGLKEELARRDAAAGEPVAYIDSAHLDEFGWGYAFKHSSPMRMACEYPVYAAAPPAVLPPEVTDPVGEWCLDDSEGAAWMAGANWMRQQCLEMGAQPQKVVEVPMPFDVAINLTRTSADIEYQYHESGENFDRDEIFSVLDAANVKWEVKK